MSDPDIIRANERYKAAANVLFQLGTALLAADVVKVYVAGGVDWEAVLWLLAAAGLIWIGWAALGLLEPEI